MMTQKQIDDSIAALMPAPAGEPLKRIAIRAAHWLLGTIEDEHEQIAVARQLCARELFGDAPAPAEWQANCDALFSAIARTLDLALALALALARSGSHTLDVALALARSRSGSRALARALARSGSGSHTLDVALALALALALRALLGDRLIALPQLDAKILAAICAPGHALRMRRYHTCDTTHCRSGWAIMIHPMGRELEAAFGPWFAGAVIYLASTGSVPNFFASDDEAMADIKRCAAASQVQS